MKKVQFDVDDDRDTFFKARDTIRRDLGKFPVYEIPPVFNSTLVVEASQKHGTLQSFFECCMSLEKDLDALADVMSLLQ